MNFKKSYLKMVNKNLIDNTYMDDITNRIFL